MARKATEAVEAVEATATETAVVKIAHVVVLPIQRGLPNGQILIAAVHGDSLVGTKQYTLDNEQVLNAKLNGIIQTSAQEGYSLEIILAARVHYRMTLRQFQRDPLTAVEYCRQHTIVKDEQSNIPGDMLPF